MFKRHYNDFIQSDRKKIKRDDDTHSKKIKQAYIHGAQRAQRGGSPPNDLDLMISKNFDEKQVEACIRGYKANVKPPEEQGIRRAQYYGKKRASSGKNIPSNEVLSSKYTPNEILAYKNAYSRFNEWPKKQSAQKIKRVKVTQNKIDKPIMENERSPKKIESPKESFIKQFLDNQLKGIERPTIVIPDVENPTIVIPDVERPTIVIPDIANMTYTQFIDETTAYKENKKQPINDISSPSDLFKNIEYPPSSIEDMTNVAYANFIDETTTYTENKKQPFNDVSSSYDLFRNIEYAPMFIGDITNVAYTLTDETTAYIEDIIKPFDDIPSPDDLFKSIGYPPIFIDEVPNVSYTHIINETTAYTEDTKQPIDDIPSPYDILKNNNHIKKNHNLYFFDHFINKNTPSNGAIDTQSSVETLDSEENDKEFVEKMFKFFNPNP